MFPLVKSPWGKRKRKQGFLDSLRYWEEPSLARPCSAAVRVLAVLASEAGSGEVHPKVDSLEDLSGDPVKPLVARPVAAGFKRDELGFLGFYYTE